MLFKDGHGAIGVNPFSILTGWNGAAGVTVPTRVEVNNDLENVLVSHPLLQVSRDNIHHFKFRRKYNFWQRSAWLMRGDH